MKRTLAGLLILLTLVLMACTAQEPAAAETNPAETALWQAGCELNGLVCLPVGRVLEAQALSESETLFVVEFLEKDGGVFVLGPCCGAEESAAAPLSVFEFHVHTQNEFSLIADMPALIP
jgi:hypothetical protein